MKFSNYTLKYILIIFFCLTISNCYSQVCPADGGDQRFGGNDAGFGFFIFGIGSWDPNQIITPKGYDSARWVSINDRMGISIFFENDPNLATAPVHNAYVYYKFPPKQDPASFRLGGYGFNGMLFTVPPNLNFYQTRLDLRDSLDLYVDVTAGINVVTNTAFWIFQSIDPLTNQPPLDPLKGFLPIKDTSITAAGDALSVKGEGFVNFTAKPMATAQTRDTIFAQAQIVFDVNDTISTNIEFNTIDARPPTSHMTMGTVVQDTIHLFWTGQDDNMGSGIQDYALFYSENNGPYILYKDKLTGLQTTFVGVTGKTYCFNIRARDNTGNTESLKDSCELSVTVNLSTTVTCPDNLSVCISAASFALSGGLPVGGTYSGNGVGAGSFNPATSGFGVHTITYTYTDPTTNLSSNCTFSISVNSPTVINCPENISVCVNAASFPLAGGMPLGGTYSGTGVSGANFNPSIAGTGVHTITYTYNDPSTNCVGFCSFTITVRPLPVVTCPGNLSVLSTLSPFALAGGTPAGGTFSGPGVNSGMFNPATAGEGVKTITYSYTDPSTNCSSSCTFTITVTTPGTVTCPGNASVCINVAPFALSALGGSPVGGTFSGTGVSDGNFNPSAAGIGVHTISYTYIDPSTNISSNCTFTITVHQQPAVTCPGHSSVCINEGLIELTGGLPGGGAYSGLGVSNGNFDPEAAGAGTHTLTYSFTHQTTGCSNSCTFTITVNALPLVTCPVNSAVCINAASFALSTLGGSPTGGTYSGTGVSGGNFNPAAAGAGTHTLTYSYSHPITGCANSCTFTITVNALPLVTCPVNSAVCINAASFALSTLGGSPTGGTYSGTGVSGGSFNPAVAGSGVKTITYTYTNPSTGCSNSCTFTITVNAPSRKLSG